MASQAEILKSIGRTGWSVVAMHPQMVSQSGATPYDPTQPASPTNDPNAKATTQQVPTGHTVWVINGPNGQNDEVVVDETADSTPQNPVWNLVTAPTKTPQVPQAPPGWTDVRATTNAGVTTYYGKGPDGHYGQVPGMPTTSDAKATPTPADKLEQIKDPNTGRVVKLRDPSTGTVIDLPDAAKDATPARPTIVNGANGAIYSWDGTTLTSQVAGTAQPKEGDTYQAVEGGRNVTKTYKGGQWVTTGVGASAIPDAPKEGDTYQAVEGGRNVTKTYRGGQWVTTGVGTSAVPEMPTTVTTNALDATIVQRNPTTGALETVPNPNYQPTDPALRAQQLQQQAQAKHDDIQKQVLNGVIQPDEGLRQWNDYWNNTIEPQRQQLQRTQNQQNFTNQLSANSDTRASQTLQQSQQNWNQDFASKAGDAAVKDTLDTLPYRVGPNMGADFAKGLNTLSSGGGAVSFSPSDFTYNMPDFETIRHQAVAHALKDISPYAASQVGAPTPQIPQNVDYTSALNQTSYGGSFAPAPQPAQPTVDPAAVVHAAVSAAMGNPMQGPSNSLDAVPQPSY
jgi:hypothetical protein